MTVQEHDQRHGGTVRRTLPVRQNLRDVKHLQAADHGCDQCVGENRADEGQRNVEKPVDAAAAVDFGCLENIRADAHNRRHQHDRRISEPHQKIHEADQCPCPEHGAEEVDGLTAPSQMHQNRIDRSVGGKHRKKEHGKCRCHDQVRKIDYNLKKLRAADFQACIHKP